MYKKINNALVHPSHSYHTRHASDVVPDYQRLTKCQSSLSYIGPIQWNSITHNIENSTSLSSFKNKILRILTSKV